MTTQTEAERLLEHMDDEWPEDWDGRAIRAELRRLQHNNLVLMDALWKACGDDEEMVNGYIESQGELK